MDHDSWEMQSDYGGEEIKLPNNNLPNPRVGSIPMIPSNNSKKIIIPGRQYGGPPGPPNVASAYIPLNMPAQNLSHNPIPQHRPYPERPESPHLMMKETNPAYINDPPACIYAGEKPFNQSSRDLPQRPNSKDQYTSSKNLVQDQSISAPPPPRLLPQANNHTYQNYPPPSNQNPAIKPFSAANNQIINIPVSPDKIYRENPVNSLIPQIYHEKLNNIRGPIDSGNVRSYDNPANHQGNKLIIPQKGYEDRRYEEIPANQPHSNIKRDFAQNPHPNMRPVKNSQPFIPVERNQPIRRPYINRGEKNEAHLKKFEINRELEQRISGFIEAFIHIDRDYVRKVVIENQGCEEEVIYQRLTSPIIPPQNLPQIFDQRFYKTQPCPTKQSCQALNCIFFHYLGEKRRDPVKHSSELCQEYPQCPKGDSCDKAHNLLEVVYHPSNLKRVTCPFIDCIWGAACIFNHNREFNLLSRMQKVFDESLNTQSHLISTKIALDSEFETIMKLKSEIERKIKCGACKKKTGNLIKVDCGHLVCSSCAKGPMCPVCHTCSKSLHIGIKSA